MPSQSASARPTMLRSTALIITGMAFCAGVFMGSLLPQGRTAPEPGRMAAPQAAQQPADHSHPEGYEKKLASIQAELVRNPTEAMNWIFLGNLHFDAGHPDEAINAYEKALELKPDNPDVMTDLGTMYRAKEQPDKAVALYDQVIALASTHQNAHFNKGITLMIDKADPEGAAAAWKSLLRAKPDAQLSNQQRLADMLAPLLVDGGTHLEHLGKREAALKAYALAEQENPAFEPALGHQAALLEQMQRQEEARAVWNRLLALNPQAMAPDGTPVSRKTAP